MKLLIVDDEETLCEALQLNLEIEGFEADTAHSAEEALRLNITDYSLILLDVMMDGMSGFRLAQKLKADPATAGIPIIFCTARGSDDDMVAGLNLGADDYIPKPYTIRNVISRVRAVLRRAAPQADKAPDSPGATADSPGALVCGDLRVDPETKTCTIAGQDCHLVRKELEILSLLLSRPGHVYSRAEILDRVWGGDVVVLDRTIDVNITRLRQKIGPYAKCIVTRTGYGYSFQDN